MGRPIGSADRKTRRTKISQKRRRSTDRREKRRLVDSAWLKIVMAAPDLRNFLALLKSKGQLLSLTDAVELRFEVSEWLRQFDHERGPALLFERIQGHSMKLAGNLLGTRERLALAFGLRS